MRNRTKLHNFVQVSSMKRRTRTYKPSEPEKTISNSALDYTPTQCVFSTTDLLIDDVNAPYPSPLNSISVPLKRPGFRFKKSGSAYPVHPCHHEKTRLILESSVDVAMVNKHFASEWTDYSFQGNVPGVLVHVLGLNASNLGNTIASMSTYGSDPAFSTPDWKALYSRYDERISTFQGSEFLVGEDLAEPGVFIDALKLVFNPSTAIRSFVKNAVKRFNNTNGRRLGQVARTLARESANANLYYHFGVKPVVEDIMAAFKAHSVVSKRMNYLLNNRGSYIPCSVKSEVRPHFSYPDLPHTFLSAVAVKGDYMVTYRMGAQARVRKDLNHNEIWKAYLQYFGINKVVQLAWELIPFSFIVDWVTNVQEGINYLTRLPIGSPFAEIRGFTCSTKLEAIDRLTLLGGALPSLTDVVSVDPSAITPLGERRRVIYDRMLQVPESFRPFDLTNLGVFQIHTGGALIIQALDRRSKRSSQ